MPKQHPAELRERAVRLVREARQSAESSYGVPARIARQLGINPDTLRGWLKQAEIDAGTRPGGCPYRLVKLRGHVLVGVGVDRGCRSLAWRR